MSNVTVMQENTQQTVLPDYPNKTVKGGINIDWRILGTCFDVWNLWVQNINIINTVSTVLDTVEEFCKKNNSIWKQMLHKGHANSLDTEIDEKLYKKLIRRWDSERELIATDQWPLDAQLGNWSTTFI